MAKAHGSFARKDDHHTYVPGVDSKAAGVAPALITRTKEMKYVSLHHHSTFSFLDGFGLPEAHVRRAAELGMPALALTEHGNVSSHVKLEQASIKEGIKPIFGCELYTGDISEEKHTQRKNHLTVLAGTQRGYRNLLQLVSRGWDEGFYYEPTVSPSMLANHREGLVVLSGCQGSLLATSLVGGKNVSEADASYDRAKRVAAAFKRELGDSYYLEVQAFPELERAKVINQAFEQLSKELKIPLVATGDCHYTVPTESEMQMILHNVRGGTRQSLEEQARSWGYDVPLSPPLSDKAVYQKLRSTGMSHKAAIAAVRNAAEIAERCTVVLPKLERLRYPMPVGGKTAKQLWLEELRKGWEYRKIDQRPDVAAYKKRVLYERSIIEEKDYVDYFLIVGDLVRFAKDSGIPVGPARGSAAASLLCYLLRITEVDPMLFPNLVFERFIDLTREDLPDIDLDFDDERRREIRDYCVAKYGAPQVGNIGSFTSYKSKLALDDIARVHKIPQWEVDKIKELLIDRSSGDLRASATIEDTVEYFEAAGDVMRKYPQLKKAMDLEGNYKGLGVHAAGLVIANGPLTDVCAVYARDVRGIKTEVISVDKYDAEYLNVIKIDLLGLSTMGLIRRCLDAVGMTVQNLYDLPLDDEKVIDAFRQNDVVGIFQFDGRAMRSVNAELQPDSFKEICDVNALARPGPLHNNASAEYIDVKRGRKEPRRIHPMLDSICGDTHYQVVYQEQILRIVREVGNFDWTHAAYIRKIISRKIGEQEFNRQWERFWKGAQENGLTYEEAHQIWGLCITAGSYAFNAAHCVSYGMIAYWTMWLKVYHPLEFYAAALTKLPKKKHLELMRDADRHEILVLPPDPNKSNMDWAPDHEEDAILAGFAQVPGIAEKMGAKILEFRSSVPDDIEWKDLLSIKGFGKKKLENILAFCQDDDPFNVFKLDEQIAEIKKQIRSGKLGRLPIPTHTAQEVPYSRGNDEEVIWLGVITHRNLRELFEVNLSKKGEALDPDTVKDPHLNEWVIMIGQDGTELLSITINRWKYPAFKDAIWGIKLDTDLVLIRGIKRGFQSRRAIYVDAMWVISPDDDEDDANGDGSDQ